MTSDYQAIIVLSLCVSAAFTIAILVTSISWLCDKFNVKGIIHFSLVVLLIVASIPVGVKTINHVYPPAQLGKDK